jgi:hypothetical protein
MIKWIETTYPRQKGKWEGFTKEDIANDEPASYEICNNTHLHVVYGGIPTMRMASTEDAKIVAELIEKGRKAD